MNIILDLDHTIYNTNQFKKTLAKCAVDLGVTPKMFWLAYNEMRKNEAFSPEILIKYFPSEFKKNKLALIKKYHQTIKQVGQNIYKDAETFLQWANKNKCYIVLYTYGEIKVQQEKALALKNKFQIKKAVITNDRKKLRDFNKCKNGNSWIWIDDFDSVPVSDKKFKSGKMIQIKRKKDRVRKNRIPQIKKLTQAIKIIEKMV
ncbi:MAG: hypothetical protein ABIE68_03775 [bacterium]